MSEQNLREMMIEDIQDDDDDETINPNTKKVIRWYLIDTDKTFCKSWDFMITLLTIYELFVVPVVMVFPTIYECPDPASTDTSSALGVNRARRLQEADQGEC